MPGPRSSNPIDQDDPDDVAHADAPDDEEDEGVGATDDEGDDDEDEGDDDDEEGGEGDDDIDELTGSGAFLGEPFALSSDLELVEATAIVKHADGRKFRIDLLSDRMKVSPHTKQKYTHALVVCPEDDDQMVPDIVRHVIEANGQSVGDLMTGGRGNVQDADEDRERRPARRRGGDIPEG